MAQEVKGLADQTGKATQQIGRQISEIQGLTSATLHYFRFRARTRAGTCEASASRSMSHSGCG